MDSFLLAPFYVLRKHIDILLAPAIPIVFLLAFLILTSDSNSTETVLNSTDYYLGGTMFLSASNLTAYNDISTNVQIPLIRLGGISEKTHIQELVSPNPSNFLLIFVVLFLGFISYVMVARAVYAINEEERTIMGLEGINGASIVLCLAAAFLMLFISSFSLGGFKLFLVISFGTYFTFSIPYAAAGQPLGESIFLGFKFMSQMGKIVAGYIGCMGAAIMIPIALLIFTGPLIINVEPAVSDFLKLVLGLFGVIFALFYQMALCASVVFEK